MRDRRPACLLAMVLSSGCAEFHRTAARAQQAREAAAHAERIRAVEEEALRPVLTATEAARMKRELRAELSPTAETGRSQVVALLELQDDGGSLLFPASHLEHYLELRIAERPEFRLVPPPILREAMTEEKLRSQNPCVDEACQIELGKALAAEKLFVPRLFRVAGRCALGLVVLDLRSETSATAASKDAECTPAALLDAVGQVVGALAETQHADHE